jgi:CO/xanthine dehydrogenase FAD-binding subunit
MTLWQQFLRPKTIDEALNALASSSAPSCLVAGGTDLLLDLQQARRAPVHTLIDVTGIPEMTVIEVREGALFVGAAVPVARIIDSPLVQEHAQALAEACALIAGPQVRNTATLGGNVAHALPAADGTIALLALDAAAEVASSNGRRREPLSNLFVGPGKTALDLGRELIAGFHLPLRKAGGASAFRRIMRTQGIALPILNVAVWLVRRKDRIEQVRIAVGPGGPVPWRSWKAEEALQGKTMHEKTIDRALAATLEEVGFRTSPFRASADYRRELVGAFLRDALEAAWQRTSA